MRDNKKCYLLIQGAAASRHAKRTLILALIASFIFPSISWAFEPSRFNSGNDPQQIRIPAALGEVTASRLGHRRLVIHIQDLHCHYEVQGHIARIIGRLADQYGLTLVGLEGASEHLNVSKLATFPHQGIRREVSDLLMREGRLTGAEYYAAMGKSPVTLLGLENAEHYQQAREQVRAFLSDETQGTLQDLREALNRLKKNVYSKPLAALDASRTAYEEGRLSLADFCREISHRAAKANLSLTGYALVARYATGRLSDQNSTGLQAQLEATEHRLREAFYTTTLQQALDDQLRRLAVAERLVNASATSAEVEAWRAAPQAYGFEGFFRFIREHLPEEAAIIPAWNALDPALEQVREFYRLADLRSRDLADNLLAEMEHSALPMAVMVTGGFHTEKVLERLRQAGVSYLSIRPRMTRHDLLNPYFTLLRQERTPLELWLAQSQNLIPVPVFSPQKDPGRVITGVEEDLTAAEKGNCDFIDRLYKASAIRWVLRSGRRLAERVQEAYQKIIAGYKANNPRVTPDFMSSDLPKGEIVFTDQQDRGFLILAGNRLVYAWRGTLKRLMARQQRAAMITGLRPHVMRLLAQIAPGLSVLDQLARYVLRKKELHAGHVLQKAPLPLTGSFYDFSQNSRMGIPKTVMEDAGLKGRNLIEMAVKLKFPVPPGFVIPTWESLRTIKNHGRLDVRQLSALHRHMKSLERHARQKFGSMTNPLLVSVRSGAVQSMPGIMETITHIGLNDKTVQGLARRTGDEAYAWRLYARSIRAFAMIVFHVDESQFPEAENVLAPNSAKDKAYYSRLAALYQHVIVQSTKSISDPEGRRFPQDPYEQLRLAVESVMASWEGEKARAYRRQNNVADSGTGVVVQKMVLGDLNPQSGAGVIYSRNYISGEGVSPDGQRRIFGEWGRQQPGEAVVSGRISPQDISALSSQQPDIYGQLVDIASQAEKYFKHPVDMEFVVEDSRLFILQCRNAMPYIYPLAKARILRDLIEEGVLREEDVTRAVTPDELEWIRTYAETPKFPEAMARHAVAQGNPVAVGVGAGRVVFSIEQAIAQIAKNAPYILILEHSLDIHDPVVYHPLCQGVVERQNAACSHASALRRLPGQTRPCILSAQSLQIASNLASMAITAGSPSVVVNVGEFLTIDGSTGNIYLGNQMSQLAPSAVYKALQGDPQARALADFELYRKIQDWIQQEHQRKNQEQAELKQQVVQWLAGQAGVQPDTARLLEQVRQADPEIQDVESLSAIVMLLRQRSLFESRDYSQPLTWESQADKQVGDFLKRIFGPELAEASPRQAARIILTIAKMDLELARHSMSFLGGNHSWWLALYVELAKIAPREFSQLLDGLTFNVCTLDEQQIKTYAVVTELLFSRALNKLADNELQVVLNALSGNTLADIVSDLIHLDFTFIKDGEGNNKYRFLFFDQYRDVEDLFFIIAQAIQTYPDAAAFWGKMERNNQENLLNEKFGNNWFRKSLAENGFDVSAMKEDLTPDKKNPVYAFEDFLNLIGEFDPASLDLALDAIIAGQIAHYRADQALEIVGFLTRPGRLAPSPKIIQALKKIREAQALHVDINSRIETYLRQHDRNPGNAMAAPLEFNLQTNLWAMAGYGVATGLAFLWLGAFSSHWVAHLCLGVCGSGAAVFSLRGSTALASLWLARYIRAKIPPDRLCLNPRLVRQIQYQFDRPVVFDTQRPVDRHIAETTADQVTLAAWLVTDIISQDGDSGYLSFLGAANRFLRGLLLPQVLAHEQMRTRDGAIYLNPIRVWVYYLAQLLEPLAIVVFRLRIRFSQPYKEFMKKQREASFDLAPGAREFLQTLAREQIPVYLATALERAEVLKTLEQFGIRNDFEEIYGGEMEKVQVIRQARDRSGDSSGAILMIGDGRLEMRAAMEANRELPERSGPAVWGIGIAASPQHSELAQYGARTIVSDFTAFTLQRNSRTQTLALQVASGTDGQTLTFNHPKAVVLDFDGTLVDNQQYIRKLFARLAAQFSGLSPERQSLADAYGAEVFAETTGMPKWLSGYARYHLLRLFQHDPATALEKRRRILQATLAPEVQKTSRAYGSGEVKALRLEASDIQRLREPIPGSPATQPANRWMQLWPGLRLPLIFILHLGSLALGFWARLLRAPPLELSSEEDKEWQGLLASRFFRRDTRGAGRVAPQALPVTDPRGLETLLGRLTQATGQSPQVTLSQVLLATSAMAFTEQPVSRIRQWQGRLAMAQVKQIYYYWSARDLGMSWQASWAQILWLPRLRMLLLGGWGGISFTGLFNSLLPEPKIPVDEPAMDLSVRTWRQTKALNINFERLSYSQYDEVNKLIGRLRQAHKRHGFTILEAGGLPMPFEQRLDLYQGLRFSTSDLTVTAFRNQDTKPEEYLAVIQDRQDEVIGHVLVVRDNERSGSGFLRIRIYPAFVRRGFGRQALLLLLRAMTTPGLLYTTTNIKKVHFEPGPNAGEPGEWEETQRFLAKAGFQGSPGGQKMTYTVPATEISKTISKIGLGLIIILFLGMPVFLNSGNARAQSDVTPIEETVPNIKRAIDFSAEPVDVLNQYLKQLKGSLSSGSFDEDELERGVKLILYTTGNDVRKATQLLITHQVNQRFIDRSGGTLEVIKRFGNIEMAMQAVRDNPKAALEQLLRDQPYMLYPFHQLHNIREYSPETGRVLLETAMEKLRILLENKSEILKNEQEITELIAMAHPEINRRTKQMIWDYILNNTFSEILNHGRDIWQANKLAITPDEGINALRSSAGHIFRYLGNEDFTQSWLDINPITHAIRYTITKEEMSNLKDVEIYLLVTQGSAEINNRTFMLAYNELEKRATEKNWPLLKYIQSLDLTGKLYLSFTRSLDTFGKLSREVNAYPEFVPVLCNVVFTQMNIGIADESFIMVMKFLETLLDDMGNLRIDDVIITVGTDQKDRGNLDVYNALRVIVAKRMYEGKLPRDILERAETFIGGLDFKKVHDILEDTPDISPEIKKGPALMFFSPDHKAFYDQFIQRFTSHKGYVYGYQISRTEENGNITHLVRKNNPQQKIIVIYLAPSLLAIGQEKLAQPLPHWMKKYHSRFVVYGGHSYLGDFDRVFSGNTAGLVDEQVIFFPGSCRSEHQIGNKFFQQYPNALFITNVNVGVGTINQVVFHRYWEAIHAGQTDSKKIMTNILKSVSGAEKEMNFPGSKRDGLLRLRNYVRSLSSIGGIMPRVKEWYVNFGNPAEDTKSERANRYDLWIAFWLENTLVLAGAGLLAGVPLYLVTGDFELAWRAGFGLAWPLFFAGHFIPSSIGERAPRRNQALAAMVMFINLVWLALPLTLPVVLVLAFFTHFAVNLIAARLAGDSEEGQALAQIRQIYYYWSAKSSGLNWKATAVDVPAVELTAKIWRLIEALDVGFQRLAQEIFDYQIWNAPSEARTRWLRLPGIAAYHLGLLPINVFFVWLHRLALRSLRPESLAKLALQRARHAAREVVPYSALARRLAEAPEALADWQDLCNAHQVKDIRNAWVQLITSMPESLSEADWRFASALLHEAKHLHPAPLVVAEPNGKTMTLLLPQAILQSQRLRVKTLKRLPPGWHEKFSPQPQRRPKYRAVGRSA